jgi:flagellar motor switch protein FliN/FliY
VAAASDEAQAAPESGDVSQAGVGAPMNVARQDGGGEPTAGASRGADDGGQGEWQGDTGGEALGRPFDEAAAEMAAAIAAEQGADAPAAAAAASSGDSSPTAFNLPDLGQEAPGFDSKRVTMLNDVDLRVKLQLGKTEMLVEDVLKLDEGSVVELDMLAGDPIDVLINDRLIARGEVLVLNDAFCVRISEVLSHDPHRVTT